MTVADFLACLPEDHSARLKFKQAGEADGLQIESVQFDSTPGLCIVRFKAKPGDAMQKGGIPRRRDEQGNEVTGFLSRARKREPQE